MGIIRIWSNTFNSAGVTDTFSNIGIRLLSCVLNLASILSCMQHRTFVNSVHFSEIFWKIFTKSEHVYDTIRSLKNSYRRI